MSTSRTLLSPIFTSGKLKGIMSAVHDSTDDFMDFLAKNNNDDLEVKDTMQICTCEILARIGCGVKPDILKDPENNLFYKQVKKFLFMSHSALYLDFMEEILRLILFSAFSYDNF